MFRSIAIALLGTALSVDAPSPPPGPPLNANMGAFTGSGTLTDRDGRAIGTWSVEARLAAGKFEGNASVTIQGQTFAGVLRPAQSYFANNRCVFDWSEGRARAEISGPCTRNGLGGFLNAFIPAGEVYSVSGYALGRFSFAAPGKAPKAGVLPIVRLTCAWMERMGGVVGGQGYHYELRFSNMGFLQLSPGGTYQTAHTSGRWVRGAGDTIKLTSGQFAGAVGHLQPDNSGQPAVYFERDENRTANDVHIVDPQRTSCTVKR